MFRSARVDWLSLKASMNITYIIGNGFDLALGLRTDYPSFIKHYVGEMPRRVQRGEVRPDSPLLKLCEDMKDNPKTWADAERAFGRLKFSSMGDKAISVYDECYDDFVGSFYDWLTFEDSRFLVGDTMSDSSRNAWIASLIRLDKYMPSGRKSAYLDYLSGGGDVVLNFINFNYTGTLEQMLGSENDKKWIVKIPQDRLLHVKVGSVCHVHGSLKTNDVVFGVDNVSQITDETVRNYCNMTGGLLKAKVDENIRAGYESVAKKILRDSQLIVLYGVSCGETDMSWWQNIYQRVIGQHAKFVVCPYSKEHVLAKSAKQKCDIMATAIRNAFRTIVKVEQGARSWLVFPNPSQTVALDTFSTTDENGDVRYCDYFGLGKIGNAVLRNSKGLGDLIG